jgi:AcrR family transcriptional regulator
MRQSAATTREQIIIAADQLFYSGSIAGVSMERIAERAGVTKKTLYYHFRSKDDLLAAYLEERAAKVMTRYRRWAGSEGSVAQRMERMFANVAVAASETRWRGCGFTRVVCELADLPGHPAAVVARLHKRTFEAWLCGMLAEEGRPDAAELARILMLLLDGSVVQTLTHRDPAYARAAGVAARLLLCGTVATGTNPYPLRLMAACA